MKEPPHPIDLSELSRVNNEQDAAIKRVGMKKYAFNVLVSNRIGERREVTDARHKLLDFYGLIYLITELVL